MCWAWSSTKRTTDRGPVPAWYGAIRSGGPRSNTSLVPTTSLTDEIRTRRDAVLDAMVELSDRSLPTPPNEVRQFILGFVRLVESAAAGDTGPRDEYLSVVIPGIRAAGFPLDATLDSMVRVAMALSSTLNPTHHRWLADFCGDYTRRLLRSWESAAAA